MKFDLEFLELPEGSYRGIRQDLKESFSQLPIAFAEVLLDYLPTRLMIDRFDQVCSVPSAPNLIFSQSSEHQIMF